MEVRAPVPTPVSVGAAVAVLAALALLAPAPAAADPGPSLRPMTVEAVQQKLAELGYLPASGVDGVWGTQSRTATIAFQKWERLVRDGIPGPITQKALAAAERPKPVTRGSARRIEILLDRQLLLLVRRGRVARTIHVSTGRGRFATPAGSYEVFRKRRRAWSIPYKVWLPWASFFVGGIAVHQSRVVPVKPASHGCVRVTRHDARWLYRRTPVGLPVRVLRRSP
ncbi:MAG TPA: L,D-transpeptidase family protein [Gaiellaceae bacterium]|nr:L,D-transpeptidase family protein [Gaiellaceae bacterium]